jgi:hypothetical protein
MADTDGRHVLICSFPRIDIGASTRGAGHVQHALHRECACWLSPDLFKPATMP